jgi:Secretion system C-terminal sorting domain
MIRSIVFILILNFAWHVNGQYAPGAGLPGSTAIHKDSSIIQSWATGVAIERGWLNIKDTGEGKASAGLPELGIGPACDAGIVSLGDGGMAVLTFAEPIANGPGWDFAVFENSFDGYFLELAFVEVSSDGKKYIRFPAHSLLQDTVQYDNAAFMEPDKLNNLAGKYIGCYGTPFDLEELRGSPGLNIGAITHIRVVDVVGILDSAFGSSDTAGNLINDPWPTPFLSGGFDIDAIGVINTVTGIQDKGLQSENLLIYPNPASEYMHIEIKNFISGDVQYAFADLTGRIVMQGSFKDANYVLYLNGNMESGIYYLILHFNDLVYSKMVFKK